MFSDIFRLANDVLAYLLCVNQGRLSDMLIRNSSEKDGAVGMRIRVVAGYCLGLCAMLGLFTTIPGEASTLQWLTIFMIGFFIYGPQVILFE